MTLQQIYDLVKGHNTLIAIAVVILLSCVEVSKIKINPWSWLFGRIGALCNKEILERLNALETRVEKIDSTMSETNAIDARARILNFGDELRRNIPHSYENYRSIFEDIKMYNSYCGAHEGFKNQMTIAAAELISATYNRCYQNNSFL